MRSGTVITEEKTELEILRRRRWANVGAVYVFLLVLSIIFIGPIVFAAISSFKDNPLEWPPRITTNQFKFTNWVGAYKLAKAGGGGGFFGEFTPGAVIPFDITYSVPKGRQPVLPEVVVPRRVPGTASAALAAMNEKFAADYSQVTGLQEMNRLVSENGSLLVTYHFKIRHTGEDVINRVPLDITVPDYQSFVKATLDPNRIERLGRVQSWNNITSGVIPYVFYNYSRVFREQYSRTTGKNKFITWILNSFYLAFARVLTTLLFAGMAGYALARLKFCGKNSLFLFLLFSMMIPQQVTFISNYLVLRNGVFGISRLFGIPSLLNSYSGLIISGLVSASAVFIMKQFFEGLPLSLEESARIDGANTYQIFFRIFLPLAKPAMGALTILTFQSVWNEFFWPLVVITAPEDKFTLTVGLLSMRRMYAAGGFDWGIILAGTLISAAPVFILFVVFQRYFVEGISFSGEKG